MGRPKTESLVPAARIQGEDDEDTVLLRNMLEEAREYLKSHGWCPTIAQEYLGDGIGGIVAVFLFVFAETIAGHDDDCLWVVVGDVPSAYFVTDCAPDPKSALGAYCDLMSDWVAAVSAGQPVDDVYPVGVPATKEYADMLRSRIDHIRQRILPLMQEIVE